MMMRRGYLSNSVHSYIHKRPMELTDELINLKELLLHYFRVFDMKNSNKLGIIKINSKPCRLRLPTHIPVGNCSSLCCCCTH